MVTLSLLDQLTKVDDRFDIEESFDALDVHHTGRLGFDRGKASFVFKINVSKKETGTTL